MVRLFLAAALLLSGCAALPSLEGRNESFAITGTGDTRLGQAIEPLAASHPNQTGIYAMPSPLDAFAARVLLAHAAERSLDAQYYIWHDDETGLMLFEALRDAARRGVRVRILLDDQATRGMDGVLAALAMEPGLEIRLYNPFAQRRGRAFAYLGEFERLNRRMHNKSLTADNQATVVGGRNIGNEYFAAGEQVPFLDLDVLAIGAAVREVSAQFDLYWNSASAYPIGALLSTKASDDAASFDRQTREMHAGAVARDYEAAIRGSPLVDALLARRMPLEWAEAHVVRDDPAKTLDRDARNDVLLLSQLLAGDASPRRSFDLVSPYFVPGDRGTAALVALAARGVRVRVLTNSMQATDVSVVHSGYAKRRCELARAGIQLFELKPGAAAPRPRKRGDDDSQGSSGVSLHAKTFASDDERIFVGSFNFDPRSALLNTEMGLVIASPVLATRLARVFDERVPANAYEVRARKEGECVEWVEHTAAGDVRYDDEPNTGALRRAWLHVLMAMPLDWML